MERNGNSQSLQALYDWFPALGDRLESCKLGTFPTPVQRMRLPGFESQGLWVKREDLSSPVQGGNKVRKLELLLARGAGPVLTFGPWGSHHVLATAVHARSLGRDCHAVLVPQPMNTHHEQVRDLVRRNCVSTVELQELDLACIWRSRGEVRKLFQSCFGVQGGLIVPPGGTNALGALGYVAAGLELRAQVLAGLCPEPRRIYVPLGTGGTAAGLALGLAFAGMRTEVVAVQVASLFVGHTLALHAIAHSAKRLLGRLGAPIAGLPELRLRVRHGFIGKGYACTTTRGERAQALASSCGLPLESTYTAKTLAAMLSERSSSHDAEPWMFMNTFGPSCP